VVAALPLTTPRLKLSRLRTIRRFHPARTWSRHRARPAETERVERSEEYRPADRLLPAGRSRVKAAFPRPIGTTDTETAKFPAENHKKSPVPGRMFPPTKQGFLGPAKRQNSFPRSYFHNVTIDGTGTPKPCLPVARNEP
jgi:hypothetical protein